MTHSSARWLAAACLFCGSIQAVLAQALPEVRIGIGLTKPPYIMESGKEGLEYEIAASALAAAGYRMLPIQMPPARGLIQFRMGKLDGLLTVDPGIGGDGYFSDPYITYENVATTLTSRHIELHRIDDLLPYSVAAFQNANAILGEQFKAMAARHRAYKEYSQQILQDKLLFTGRVDVVIGDRMIFQYFATQMEAPIDAAQKVTFSHIFPPNPRHAVFHDRDLRDRFNKGLQTIHANGVYDAIVNKYRGFMQR